MRPLRPLFFVLLCAAASQGAVAIGASPVRLLAPADGAELRGGEVAALRWAAGNGFDHLDRAEEWEAFLSLDGGSTFAFRITPHLDAARRTIWWQVPNFSSADARLLLRFGDERHETEVELPQRLRIVAGPAPPALSPRNGFTGVGGEAARPGAPGVVAWVDGDRSGKGWRQAEAAPPAGRLGDGNAPRLREGARSEVGELGSGHLPAAPDMDELLDPDAASERAGRTPRLAQLPVADILLLIRRQNE